MLIRIKSIKHVGLFRDASAVTRTISKAGLFYADNGRGKSTFTNILRSLSSNDPSPVLERQTVGVTGDPSVHLLFDGNHDIEFRQGAWSEGRPEIRIFDSDFIVSHVHAGNQVTPEHRKNLLDYALGESALDALALEDQASEAQRLINARIRELQSAIDVYAGSVAPAVFRATPVTQDAERKLAELRSRKAAASRVESLRRLPRPVPGGVPSSMIEEVFAVLRTSLRDVHAEAEHIVDAHLQGLDHPNAHDWLLAGQQFDATQICPFCGQATDGLDLIRMYASHFDSAFRDLTSAIRNLAERVDSELGAGLMDGFVASRDRASAAIAAWAEHLELPTPGGERDALVMGAINELKDLLLGLLARKSGAPSDSVGTPDEETEAQRLWEVISRAHEDQAQIVSSVLGQIDTYIESLDAESVARIDEELARVESSVTRHSPEVVGLFSALGAAEDELNDATARRSAARESLNSLMASTLRQFRVSINEHLTRLGAGFQIKEIVTNYLGGVPRTDYAIELRGETVRLSGGRPTFATALSEADKRTLAFAFFVATTLDDPNLQDAIVVVDDPISSFDRSRRSHTISLLVKIAVKAKQLIVLAHDPVFLRDLDRALKKHSPSVATSVLAISRVQEGFSNFSDIDLDRECESDFHANYRAVSEFVKGVGSKPAKEVASSLRPLLEGHLHRRFPGELSSDVMLGAAIAQIEQANPGTPLHFAKPLVDELRELNAFAGKFHHDTNPDFRSEPADENEVVTFGARILEVIHRG